MGGLGVGMPSAMRHVPGEVLRHGPDLAGLLDTEHDHLARMGAVPRADLPDLVPVARGPAPVTTVQAADADDILPLPVTVLDIAVLDHGEVFAAVGEIRVDAA